MKADGSSKVIRRRLAPFTVTLLAILALYIATAVFAPWVAPHDPYWPGLPLQPPSTEHPFGTDQIGRDILSRTIFGARVSLLVGIASVGLGSLVGVCLGLIAGYAPRIEPLIMRLMDALWAYPAVLLALGLGVAVGPGFLTVVAAIAIVYTPVFARLAFSQTKSIKEREFVSGAVALGAGAPRVVVRHILPNILAALVVQFTLSVGTAMIFESTLSFLGLGIQPPTPSWGVILRNGYSWMHMAPWIAVAPGIAIFGIVLVLNLLGDRLRIALDPRNRGRS